MGRVTALFGVKGWVKVYSDTESRGDILQYDPWHIGRGAAWAEAHVEEGHLHGKTVVAKLAGVDDRDEAALLVGSEVAVDRGQLAPLEEDEYYWVDLIGLRVRTLEGQDLGRVARMMATGANDVMVVQGDRERLIPFVEGQVVKDVDLDRGLVVVDWASEF